jgi:golgin subfamily A member 2
LLAENETFKSQLTLHESDKIELNQKLSLANEEIENLKFQMERIKIETPNVSQLMVDFEDKSTAASRALSQNQSLKFQLEELQRAFVNISNDKMELTDKLQSEMHLGKEMKNRYDAMEVELSEVKDKWQFKENEMIRLSHENTELEKKILKQNIEIDRLRHYESTEHHRGEGGVLEKELENCRHLIESLTNKINVLESGNEHDHSHNHDGHSHNHDGHAHNHDGHSHNHDGHSHSHDHTHDSKCEKHPSTKDLLNEIEMLKMEKNELLKAINDFRRNKTEEAEDQKAEEPQVNGEVPEEMTDEKMRQMTIPKSVTPSMATEEALEKLQERFRRTMLEVADLTEEKNRLEHVVTQLQFETETIGEYITLYQNQRRHLKQKELERDIQLKNLAADRELMNKKLLQLNGLIEKFVLQHTDQIEVAKEATKILENENVTGSEPLIISGSEADIDFEKLKKETAGKILEILSDIKTTNTKNYDSNIGVENSCSCCLGRLETV